MKRIVLASLIVFLAIGITFFVRLSAIPQNADTSSSESNSNGGSLGSLVENEESNSGSPSSNSASSGGNFISSSVLSKHNKQSDCWVAYDGKVYDITSYLPKHPGSAGKIAPYCGTSEGFINAFEGKHGTSKVSLLMKVGTLMGDFDIVGSV